MIKNTTNIPFDGSALQLGVGKLIAITAETAVTACILTTLAISVDAPVRGFKTHPEYAGVFDVGDCMSSEHFGQSAWQFKRMSGSSGLKVQAAIAC